MIEFQFNSGVTCVKACSFLSSFNCIDWHLLPPTTEDMLAEVSAAAKGRFVGDPSHEYEHTETRRQGEGDDAVEEEVSVRVSVMSCC